MEIRVVRCKDWSTCVQSQVLIDGTPFCYGLEPPLKPHGGGPVCIPEGSYEVWLRWSLKHGCWVPAVSSVPGRSNIEIHPGNEPDDTIGCLLVGAEQGPGYVSQSRDTFGILMQHIIACIPTQRVTIRYVNQFAQPANASVAGKLAMLVIMAVLWLAGMGVALKAQAQQDTQPKRAGQPVQAVAVSNPQGTRLSEAEAAKGVEVPAPVRRIRTADRYFFIAEGLRWGAAVSDWETTRHFVNETACTESAPGFGPKPSAARIYGIAVPIEAAFTVGNYFLRRHMWHASRADRIAALIAGEAPLTAGHAFAAYMNRTCFGPGFAK